MDLNQVVGKIHWLGHDAFRLEGSRTVYFDPFKITAASLPPADLILITHEHFDHCSPEDVEKVRKKSTVIVTDAQSAKKLEGNVRIVAPGEDIEIGGVGIKVLHAYNTNKNFHPKSAGMLSFVVSLDGVSYFHAGDTDLLPEMSSLRVDVAFLPVSGTYVMTAEEAVEAARAIKPAVAIPMHYGRGVAGTVEDAKTFQKALEGEMRVVVLDREG
jgi:L-ascorbate metabolism protein UlaG (beta-lactamase superfamily)